MITRTLRKSKYVFYGPVFVLTLIAIPVIALADSGTGAETDPLLDDLLQELQQLTEVATHTKLNVDYVPGMVTVLHGQDLINRGIHTLGEALQTVPGVEISVEPDGQSAYVMRGIGKSYSSGKVKMLLNGRSNNAALSAATTISLIPAQFIERLEIIRGPGSAIYGEYAYAGVVNIVSRKTSQAFAQTSLLNRHSAGLGLSNFDGPQSLKYAFNFSVYDYKGDNVTAGADYLKSFNSGNAMLDGLFNGISNSPGKTNEVDRIIFSTLQLEFRDYKWDSSFAYQNVGDFFGFAGALPPEIDPLRTVITSTSDITRSSQINSDLNVDISLGARAYALRSELHYFQPAGFPDPSAPGTFFTDGVRGAPNYTEYEARGDIELHYTGLRKHDLLAGLHGAYIRQGDTWAERNHEVLSGGSIGAVPIKEYRGSENWLTEGNRRLLLSLYAQDQWQLAKPLTLTYGGRVDHYRDIGSSINPRVAAVYNFLDYHVVKAQYSRAFRPPTFIEMFAQNNTIAAGNPNIKPETTQSIEAGYIYNNQRTVVRTTVFYTQMDELITNDSASGQYQNLESVDSTGLEIEFEQKFTSRTTFKSNATALRVEDRQAERSLPKIARIFGYASLLHRSSDKMSLSLSGQYIGERLRETGDTRDPMEPYYVVNVGVNLRDILTKGLSIHLGAKNMLDAEVRHPAGLTKLNGVTLPAYKDDLPRTGREVWAHVEYEF